MTNNNTAARSANARHHNFDRTSLPDKSIGILTLEQIANLNALAHPLPRVYLAGKIGKNDWRHDLVPGLRRRGVDDGPITLEGWTYVGPFFVACDHGCFHGPNTHGAINPVAGICSSTAGQARLAVIQRNTAALAAADLVFAYITARDCFGTIAELGSAVIQGKRVVICFAPDVDASDFWYITVQAGAVYGGVNVCCLQGILKAELAALTAANRGRSL